MKPLKIVNQLNIMVSYVDMIGLSQPQLRNFMRPKCQVMWLRYYFLRMLIAELGQYTYFGNNITKVRNSKI